MRSNKRQETRRERYEIKASGAQTYPIYLATINFTHDANLAFLVRAAACFGVKELLVIGNHPPRNIMNELSGTMFDYVRVRTFGTTNALLSFIKEQNINLICLELPGETYKSKSLHEYKFDFTQPICIMTGNESVGIPGDVLLNSDDIIHIPMPGVGFCLNTSQAANIALYEAIKQYENGSEQ
jgi:tRNA G18 (ribose-2'-O)-methylase SpoU